MISPFDGVLLCIFVMTTVLSGIAFMAYDGDIFIYFKSITFTVTIILYICCVVAHFVGKAYGES